MYNLLLPIDPRNAMIFSTKFKRNCSSVIHCNISLLIKKRQISEVQSGFITTYKFSYNQGQKVLREMLQSTLINYQFRVTYQ